MVKRLKGVIHISTLTRRESRVRQIRVGAGPHENGYFNPHPARKPGATCRAGRGCAAPRLARISTLTRRESRVRLRRFATGKAATHAISTLTRRESRVRRLTGRRAVGVEQFQPSPGAKAGCDGSSREASSGGRYFNPHPARKPGATATGVRGSKPLVSFQPSPGAKAGCDLPRPHESTCSCNFNPHPARKPGATQDPTSGTYRGRYFNPHPARKPGATALLLSDLRQPAHFNPHPARKPGATHEIAAAARRLADFNPHPARKPGATRPRGGHATSRTRFQPSPGAKAGCDEVAADVAGTANPFQPSPGAKAGCDSLTASLRVSPAKISTLTRRESRVRLKCQKHGYAL